MIVLRKAVPGRLKSSQNDILESRKLHMGEGAPVHRVGRGFSQFMLTEFVMAEFTIIRICNI